MSWETVMAVAVTWWEGGSRRQEVANSRVSPGSRHWDEAPRSTPTTNPFCFSCFVKEKANAWTSGATCLSRPANGGNIKA